MRYGLILFGAHIAASLLLGILGRVMEGKSSRKGLDQQPGKKAADPGHVTQRQQRGKQHHKSAHIQQ